MQTGNRFYLMMLTLAGIMLVTLAARADDLNLSGWVQDEQGLAVSKFTVGLQGKTFEGRAGKFSASLEKSNLLEIQITADGYFPITHTFSVLELSAHGEGITIPPITLVGQKKGRVMLALGGDVMMGRRFIKPRAGERVLIRAGHEADDAKEIVRQIKPYFENADYGLVNLETQIMARKPKGSAPKAITFFSPPETVDALAWAGIDYVTLGNNHTYDNLEEGLVSTLDILGKSALGFSGAGINEVEALKPYRTKISGTPYSFLGYVGWKGGSDPHQAAEGLNKGGAALGTMENIVKTVKAEAGLDQTTVVQLHASLEYGEEPTLATEQRLKTAIDQGADLAIAHHPHVVQGFEIYKDRLIAYSLGNFIFDQYFYAPQFSYMVYVWMDGQKFHRAEIIPLYLKGYKPTPAVGQVRSAVLKRTATLSARRNIILGYSGGHGVITPEKMKSPAPTKAQVSLYIKKDNSEIISLDRCWASQFVTGLSSTRNDIQYRLGQDMLRRGDFESFDTFDAPERGWIKQGEDSGVSREQAFEGQNSFKIIADHANLTAQFGMKVFTRVFKPSNPMTFSGQLWGEKDVMLDFYLQGRPNKWGLAKSLEEGPREHLGTVKMEKGPWRKFAVDFDSPRIGFNSYRITVEASSPDGSQVSPVYFDDVALIEWQTSYRETGQDSAREFKIIAPNRITHVEVRGEATPADNLELTFENHGFSDQVCKVSGIEK